MNVPMNWLGRVWLLLALLLVLPACGSAPIVQSQSGTVGDEWPGEANGLDQALLRQVDEAIATARASGQDVKTVQTLRDSAVALAKTGNYAEANGNLKIAAQQIGVLLPIGGEPQTNTVSQLPDPPVSVAATDQHMLLNATFTTEDSLAQWERIGPTISGGTPLWDVRDGLLIQRGVEGVVASDEQTGLVTGDPSWSDVIVQVTVLGRDTREVGVIVRQQGENYYRFRALVIGSGTTQGNYVLEKVVNGDVTRLASFDGAELGPNTWHTLSVVAQGNTLTCSVDDKPIGVVKDDTLARGRVGVSTLAMSGAYFANIVVIER